MLKEGKFPTLKMYAKQRWQFREFPTSQTSILFQGPLKLYVNSIKKRKEDGYSWIE